MNFLKGISKFILFLIAVYVFSAFFAKSNYNVERTRVMSASQKLIYTQIGILKNWENWSPWKERDPLVKFSYEGKDASNGAMMYWKGGEHTSGSGSIEIVQADPPYSMVYKLSLLESFAMSSKGSFILSAESSERTQVRWTNHGELPFLLRPLMMFMDMDKEMGPDFERGLFKIDSICSNLEGQIQTIMQRDSLKN